MFVPNRLILVVLQDPMLRLILMPFKLLFVIFPSSKPTSKIICWKSKCVTCVFIKKWLFLELIQSQFEIAIVAPIQLSLVTPPALFKPSFVKFLPQARTITTKITATTTKRIVATIGSIAFLNIHFISS